MDEEPTQDLVRDVLEHLYDRAYLERHPLAALAARQQPGEARGQALQRELLDAIQTLRPEPNLTCDSLAWRKYRYLYLRYVQAVPAADIADELGISVRQSRRYAREALGALAVLLRDRWSSVGSSLPPVRDAAPSAAPATPSPVDQEVAMVEGRAQEARVPVADLLRGVAGTIRPLAERRDIALALVVVEDLPPVAADRTALRQALLSLLSLCFDLQSAAVELSAGVDCTGAGISVRLCSRVPLGVAARDRLVGDERWGIARRLVEAQGGRIQADPLGEDGLVISLTLRAINGPKVLIVEDNADALQLYRRYLSDSHYRMLAATDGARALESAEAERPAAIVLDVMMPSQDGWEILQLLKANPETRAIPVVICSVLRERELALALGAIEFLVKPVSRDDLLLALERLCSVPPGAHQGSPGDSD